MDNKEYRIDIKLRNNIILKWIEFNGYSSVNDFCRKNKISAVCLRRYINFKETPLTKSGDFTKTIKKTASALKVLPEQLFSEEQLTLQIENNKRSLQISSAELIYMINQGVNDGYCLEDFVAKEEMLDAIEKSLETLPPRTSKVLKLKLGLEDGKIYDFKEIGKMINVSGVRATQIYARGLRNLRHPSISSSLLPFYEEVI